ncbi:hypothetical protein TSUD_258780 [Trifolium subterraneum]|uniref:Retrotransposon Copia-like N-terminal domain-containing protein n=1 Tax=Trifolium subterraneum TaxID=3900 RepID=A0A2Z6N0W9_TRISU|nr:hypothetical protein TSUD_258780 [Trifolium subterraneum]
MEYTHHYSPFSILASEHLSLKALDPLDLTMSVANKEQKNDLPSTVSVKLDRDNYPLWKSLVLPLIRGCKYDGYMLGTKQCPNQFLTSTDNTNKINPDFEDWQANDQALLGWLMNSMTVDIATQVLHCETSKQLWDEAQSLAGAHTRSKIIYLKSEFHNTHKGEMKMEQYLAKMKNLADKLKLAGSPISSSDLMIQTLNELDSEYNPVVVKLSDQINISWEATNSDHEAIGEDLISEA